MKFDNIEQLVLLENLKRSQTNENVGFPVALLETQLQFFIT